MDYEDFVKAFREEEKKEMSKTKSIVRVKTKHSDKIRSEKYRQEFKKNILNTLTHDMHRYKRVAYLSYLRKTGETGKKTPAEAGVDDGSMREWGSYSGVSLG